MQRETGTNSPSSNLPQPPSESLAPREPRADHWAMTEHAPLDCLKCPALCCRMAGYVRVSREDIRRLARFLGLTVPEFERRHIVERTRGGEKRIKAGFRTCQFLSEDRLCTVYKARPKDCRGYVCWNQEDETVYDFARFLQTPPAALRFEEDAEDEAEAAARKAARKKKRRR